MYCFDKDLGYHSFNPLLLISFTEYPSSPSPYIYVGDEQEGGDA